MMSDDFRKFLIVMIGTFLGVFFALNLFTALNKPSMPCPPKSYSYNHYEYRMDPDVDHEYFNEDVFGREVQKPEHKNIKKK